MTQIAQSNYIFHQSAPINFCGHNYTIRAAKNYLEKIKVTYKADNEISESFYKLYQKSLPKWIAKPLQKIEKFINFVTMFPTEFAKKDIQCVINEEGKIVGSVSAEKIMRSYHIYNLYLDDTIKNTKDSPKVLTLIVNKIKELAEQKHISTVSCQVYDKAKSLIRLYEKAGFKAIKLPTHLKSHLVIDMEAKTKDLGLNFGKYKERH